MDVLGFLTGSKLVPDLILRGPEVEGTRKVPAGRRNVIYKPKDPSVIKGLYGDKDVFSVKVRVSIGSGGNVKSAEHVTTTGYPQIDMMATNYVKQWLFEPAGGPGADEEMVVEVEVYGTEGAGGATGGGARP